MQKQNKSFTKKNYRPKLKFRTPLCKDGMTFQECELAILRHAVDETDKLKGQKQASSDDIKKILKIVEDFLIKKKLVCYGGTAINNILPKFAQFYDKEIDIPDYDFFSPNALEDAKELADIYYKHGYSDVEAKAGMHMGTFKVFVNFIPIADITYLDPRLYNSIFKDAILVAGIRYAPPDYLRMAMYLELSRPAGDVSRWEKVLKRLTLLNQYYPLKFDIDCHKVSFQRKMQDIKNDVDKIYLVTRDALVDQGVVFFGGYATSMYSKYMPLKEKHLIQSIPDFDVLAEDIDKCALILKEQLNHEGFPKVKLIKYDAIGEIIPEHVEILVGKDTIAFIYKPIACHSYNTLIINGKEVNVATIDTILTFYLSFIYAGLPYYKKDRLLCMAKFLFDVEEQNRLEQRGLLKRFSINCYGKQKSMEDMRAEKAEKYKELKMSNNKKDYEMWFLKYTPGENNLLKQVKKPTEQKSLKNENIDYNEVPIEKDESINVVDILKSAIKKRRTIRKR
jgi:hypothetical protein